MAATLHAKMNRKKLNKLNIIKICEEILNPSVPMALRLSGILMGGVVIVYERKVKLLYDDVTRLLVEINEAWKIKAAPDPTVLPKGKLQAKKEAVTLPEKDETDFGEVENSHNFSIDAPTMGFQQTAYFAMRLDDVDEPYVGNDGGEGDPFQDSHQADAENITLFERFDLHQGNTDMYNRFERFDIEGDEETQVNFTSGEHTQMPTSHIPSPPHQDEPLRDIHSGVGSDPVSREIFMEDLVNNDQYVVEEVTANFLNNNIGASKANLMVTPVDYVRFNPSSGSGHRILSNSSEANSGRSNQKRPRSFSRHGSSGLESVAEENRSGFSDPNFQLSNLSESDLAHDQELLVETGPTQTQPRPPISNPQVDKMTDSIRTQMKMHFETPGAPEIESLHKLAAGLKRKGAAVLFYQTCVLASRDELRVEQKVPYGDILLSKGSKM
ncbi:hypothetical protein LWI29_023635 [Acer saccharum]|uniref:Sister chromatid cohesion 1 protein 1 n=1 Tax=Acer saccharum TaxID=4024 RepID=A0AA39VU92_ACESA|nr:hypothetical protein LWI29_023635 [Acer saccharum]